jgi:hypothetical protein
MTGLDLGGVAINKSVDAFCARNFDIRKFVKNVSYTLYQIQFAYDADKYACWTVYQTILADCDNHCLTCI